ncbi:peptidase M48 [Sphingobium sp. 22B]|uniref:M48 family metallopeptidase n=1 Tax=unclassified Sphingobium TaxID=2611147 RepID=UPI0007835FB8|nr:MULTISPECIES: M48 family metalloprotease [unclassified Sphingobium]KXU32963.1 peptidase M48 [Sphingobium sp. AM]KYC33143.1 peptidase M48 [Sphingobium sp. 22B]OAP33200.1 peptidase M48 [Sphingobium sp. 20006FA]
MTGALLRAMALLALTLPVAAVATPGPSDLPPYSQAYQPQGTDERGLWMLADEDERELRDSKFLIDDPALQAYVAGVLCRAVGQDRCRGVRIYLVRVASFNANMAPNGTMQVWSGLLLRVRSEAELAAVLGHEFAHFELRHSLSGFRRQRSATDIAAWAAFLGQYGATVQQAAVGSFFQFNRDQEKQADLLSLKYAIQSPYSAQAAAHVWQRLMDEADATALGRKQRSQRYDRVAFFSTHPTNLDRATYLAALSADVAAKPEGAESYSAALAKWLPDFLSDQMKLNDFGGTEYLLSSLAGEHWTAPLLFARAELYRQRGNPRDLAAAADFYRSALAADPGLAEGWRGLGLCLMRNRQRTEGADALKNYIRLRPQAADIPMLQTMTGE